MSEPTSKKAPPPPPQRSKRADASATAATSLPGHGMEPPPPSTGSKLKVVTVSPGSVSLPDTDVRQLLKSDSAPPPARGDPYLGCTIDSRYKVETVLGEGGMGVVYRCSHKIIGKKVAMKVLRADLARDKEVTERFLNEAKTASAIGNPHIIDISDFGELPDGSTYFVMEYLDGVPLSTTVEGGTAVPVPRILHIARQLAEGLSAAHRADIVHRDLKPDNIYLVTRGDEKDFVKVLDFGIAKVSSGGGKLTRAGAVFGTPHYMSPEQAAGAPVDHRGDIYSFGVILYELASGKVPFDADNFMGILTQHMYKAPVPIRALVPQPQDVPPGLEAIVLKCLSKRPEQRYQSMDELIIELDRLKDGLIPDAVPEMMSRSGGFNVPADYFEKAGRMPAPVPATPGGVRRSRWPLIAGVAGVGAAIGIVVAIFVKSAESSASPPSQSGTASNAAAPAGRVDPNSAASASAPASRPATPPNTRQVALAIEPLDAHVFKGHKDLGASPVLLNVPRGSTVQIEVRHRGYHTKKLTLDGSKTKELVKLVPVRSYHPAVKPRPVRRRTTNKPSIGGGEIVNPWAH